MLEAALERDPLHPGAILQYSRNLSALGRPDEAVEWAMRLPPLWGFGEREIAMRFVESQQLDKAVEWYLQANLGDPRNIRDIASILGSLGAPGPAAEWFGKISDDEVFGPPAAAMVQLIRGDAAGALAGLEASIGEGLGHPSWLYYAAWLALRAGQHEKAVTYLERTAPALADPLAPEVDESNVQEAILLAEALDRSGGEAVRIGVLSGMVLSTSRNRPATGWDGVGLRAARIYALQGEAELALAAARRAYDEGYRFFYGSDSALVIPLDRILQTDSFGSLLERLDEDLAVMRANAIDRVQARPDEL